MFRLFAFVSSFLSIAACVDERGILQSSESGESLIITARAVTWRGEPVAGPATFAAYQEGDGPWSPMTFEGDHYVAAISPGRYAVAIANRLLIGAEESTVVRIKHATTSEIQNLIFENSGVELKPFKLNLEIRGVTDEQQALVQFAGRSKQLGNGIYQFASSRSTESLYVSLSQRFVPVRTPLKLFRLPNLNLVGASPIIVDFNLPLTGPIASPAFLDGVPAARLSTRITAEDGDRVLVGDGIDQAILFPPSLARASDRIEVSGEVWASDSMSAVSANVLPAGPFHLSLGAPSNFSAAAMRGGHDLGLSFSLVHTPRTGLLSEYEVIFEGIVFGDWRYLGTVWLLTFTPEWLVDSPGEIYNTPNFNGLPGWTAEFYLRLRSRVSWEVTRRDMSSPFPQPGRVTQSYSSFGEFGEYCGDGVVQSVYEQCDPPDGDSCSSSCKFTN